MTAIGASGVLVIQRLVPAFGSFIGFEDAEGLVEVDFVDLGNDQGIANYGFDNVVTAAIDEPASWMLIGAGIAALAALSRRRPAVAGGRPGAAATVCPAAR